MFTLTSPAVRTEPIVLVRGLTKSFGRGLARSAQRTLALEDVSLAVNAGELVAITGDAGAGKTTLIQCLCGLLRPDSGEVCILGESPFACPGMVAYVPAVPVFYPFFSVSDVLQHRVQRAAGHVIAWRQTVVTALELTNLVGRATARVASLSRAELKRLALAEALVVCPQILLLDTAPADAIAPLGKLCGRLMAGGEFAVGAILLAAREAAELGPVAARVMELSAGRLVRHARNDTTDVPQIVEQAPWSRRRVAEAMH